jgi:hypothetical protein
LLNDDALRRARAAGEHVLIATTLVRLARSALDVADITDLPTWLDEAMANCGEIDSICGRIELIEIRAKWAVHCARWELVVCLIGAAEVHAGRLGKRSCPEYRHGRSGFEAQARAALGLNGYDASLAEGHAFPIDDAMARVRAGLRELSTC